MKFAVFAAAVVALGCAGLAGCKQEPAAQPSEAAPEAPAGIGVSEGRLVLPAVKGNPGAVYFDLANTGDTDTALASAFVEGAESAMLHTTTQSGGMSSMKAMTSVPLPAHSTLKFAPGGNHVMAMGLPDTLKPGESVEVTLTFADGDKVSFDAAVHAAGDVD